MSKNEREKLAAPCGLYCGACSTYITRQRGGELALNIMAKRMAERWGRTIKTEDIVCEGCLSSQVAIYCRRCAMRACTIEKGMTHCAQCSSFPCQTIANFNNDGAPHHSEVLTNVRHQKEIGINAWLDEQEKRWRCPTCSQVIEWYDTKCPRCEGALPKQF